MTVPQGIRRGGRLVAVPCLAADLVAGDFREAPLSFGYHGAQHDGHPAADPTDITRGPTTGADWFAQRWRDLMTAVRDCGVAARQNASAKMTGLAIGPQSRCFRVLPALRQAKALHQSFGPDSNPVGSKKPRLLRNSCLAARPDLERERPAFPASWSC